ncbi:MAG: terminase family protein [Phenylobacterium sp.]|uniref:terminase large subunit domain-containing protein n=1 Tax=Phenylobacterium sp. TaxID=1871053 RepID=UPI001A4CB36D|nr:terminase family protein [Phenylobacterium sp.]MBL8773889.1 terminase family protein [Phenylobacterium sp.]
MSALAALIADPKATLRALDCLEARDSFMTFCGMVEIPSAPVDDESDDEDEANLRYQPPRVPTAAHHIELCGVLQAIDEGRIKRAMFFLPPGTAKSTYGSVLFPAWFLGRKRRRNVGVATYSADLARKLGRRMRAVARQPAYREIFDAGVSQESAAANEWALDNGNEFMGNGILAGWTGNRLDGLVIDDPVKGRKDAESEAVRKSTVEAYQDDLLTRLKPNGWVLLIQTRWHEEDLAGSLLPDDYDGQTGWVKCKDGEYWYVVCIPAQAERADDPLGRTVGAYIWPEWFGREGEENPGEAHFAPHKTVARTWASLYQQRPRPRDGTFFQKAWFKRYVPDQLPSALSRYMTSDHAPGGMDDSDFTAVRVWGVDSEGDLWLLDGFRHQATMDVTVDLIVGNERAAARPGPVQPDVTIRGLIRKHKPFAWFPEDDNNWKAVAGFVARRMREEGVSCRIEPMSPHGQDKEAKAQAFQAMAASGRVWLPVGPMGDDVLDQYLRFPVGRNDDEVDAAGVIGRAIDEAHPAIVRTERPVEKRQRYAKKRRQSSWAA